MSRTLVIASLCATLSAPLAAEDATLSPGTRIRLQTSTGPVEWSGGAFSFNGRLVGKSPDSITVLPPGGEVATYAKPDRWLAGELVDVEPGWLVVASTDGSETWRVPREAVTQFQLGHGRSRTNGVLRSAGVGLLAGAGLGLLMGDDPEDQLFAFSAGEKAAALGIVGAGVGAVAGLIAGGGVAWQAIETDALAVSVEPAGATAARVALSF